MRPFILIISAFLSASCGSAVIKDYASFYEKQPNTILVLPVVNETTSSEAPDSFLSTIANPLIHRGYYVMPVTAGIAILRSNGIFEGAQLANISPSTFGEVLGVDAVLYVTLHSWDTNYLVFASSVSVSMTYKLVDTDSGDLLWEDSRTQVVQSDSNSNNGILAILISAAVTAAATDYVPLARQGNAVALESLPAGPLSPDFDSERNRYLSEQ
jgi:hypothetical protein